MKTFGSTCPSCGSAHAYVSILSVECVSLRCNHYNVRQVDAYNEWTDKNVQTAVAHTTAAKPSSHMSETLCLAAVRAQTTDLYKNYYMFTLPNGSTTIVNIPKDFLEDAKVPIPPGMTDLGIVGIELLASCDSIGVIKFDFDNFTWMKK